MSEAKHNGWTMRLDNPQFLFYRLVVDGVRVADVNFANVGTKEAAALARRIEAVPALLGLLGAIIEQVKQRTEQHGDPHGDLDALRALAAAGLYAAEGDTNPERKARKAKGQS